MKMYQTATNRIQILCLAAATTFLLSCGGKNSQPAHQAAQPEAASAVVQSGPQFADAGVSEAWKQYMELRKSLVETNATAAAAAAKGLQETLAESQPELRDLAAAIAGAADVEAQRALFAEFVGKSEAYFAGSLSGGTVYKQFCPMAFGNKGGYWLSDVAEIRNPYFGDKMLTCGTVAETIVN